MLNRSFIFSESRKVHLMRHLLFWFFWWLYFGLLHAANPMGLQQIAYFKNVPYAMLESGVLITPHLFLTYAMLLFVLPRYLLNGKYFATIGCVLILVPSTAFINLYLIKNINPWVLTHVLPVRFRVTVPRSPAMSFFMALMNSFKGGVTVAAFATVIKFMKFWYLKEQRNLQLQKENTDAQIQLLTAQVHPHFLFNTLNNIYSAVQTTSVPGSKMIMGLSDLLRYVLYEGKKSLVPLQKELQMIQEYINLEKIRYGNKLDIHYLITDKTDDIFIAPLLLLPFVENCFKHGASNILENPWISLTIELKETTLVMKLMNGKAVTNEIKSDRQGIGISNVSKRLELLYQNKHALQVREEEEVFVVDLKVQLVRITEKETTAPKQPADLKYAEYQ
jgi:Histidine kinase